MDRPEKPNALVEGLDEGWARYERAAIVEALGKASGNVTEAAKLLGIKRTRLYGRMAIYELTTPGIEQV